jgi:hypothetical protein
VQAARLELSNPDITMTLIQRIFLKTDFWHFIFW